MSKNPFQIDFFRKDYGKTLSHLALRDSAQLVRRSISFLMREKARESPANGTPSN